MSGKGNHEPWRSATTIRRSRDEARTVFVRSLLEGMKHARMSQSGKPSAAKLARELGKDTRTARRILAGKQKLDFEALRTSSLLWPHFFRCLVYAERKARVI